MQALSFAELPLPAQYRPTDWSIGGLGLVYLAWQSIVYPCLAAAIDAWRDLPCADASHTTPGSGVSASALTGAAALPDAGQRDEDVMAEDRRVASGAADASSAVLVKNIKKVPAPALALALAAGPWPLPLPLSLATPLPLPVESQYQYRCRHRRDEPLSQCLDRRLRRTLFSLRTGRCIRAASTRCGA